MGSLGQGRDLKCIVGPAGNRAGQIELEEYYRREGVWPVVEVKMSCGASWRRECVMERKSSGQRTGLLRSTGL